MNVQQPVASLNTATAYEIAANWHDKQARGCQDIYEDDPRIEEKIRERATGDDMPALEWSRETPYHVARIRGLGHYAIERYEGGCVLMGSLIGEVREVGTFAAAKAAAEADYERRMS